LQKPADYTEICSVLRKPKKALPDKEIVLTEQHRGNKQEGLFIGNAYCLFHHKPNHQGGYHE